MPLQRKSGLRRTPFQAKRAPTLRRSRMKARPYRSLTTRKGLKDALDKLTSLIVRKRDGRCVSCGTTENLECSHYYKRRFLPTRWNLKNCNAQCSEHNDLHNENPFPYRAYMVAHYGEEVLEELFELRNTVWRPSDEDLRALLEDYRQRLKEMQ